MSYVIERAVAHRRHDLLRDAQRERVARVYPGQRHLSLRRPLGRFLVRLGSRLGSAPRREARLAGSAGNVA